MTIHERFSKDDLIQAVADRTGNSPRTVEKIMEAILEEIYESLKRGQSVTLKNFGSFYVRPERQTWVFKFNPAQRLRALFGWASTHKGEL